MLEVKQGLREIRAVYFPEYKRMMFIFTQVSIDVYKRQQLQLTHNLQR